MLPQDGVTTASIVKHYAGVFGSMIDGRPISARPPQQFKNGSTHLGNFYYSCRHFCHDHIACIVMNECTSVVDM